MSGFFESMLSRIFDVETAPACAQDPCSVGAAPDLAGSGYSYSQEPEWHNNYGTAADYQVPAETFDCKRPVIPR